MKKFLLYGLLISASLGLALRGSLEFEKPREVALKFFTKTQTENGSRSVPTPDALQVFLCGTASPINNSGRAQACVAVLTPQHFYLVDVGAGSTSNLQGSGLPLDRLQGILITHFHSDHIAEIYEANLLSWVTGRPEQLKVYGPEGIKNLVRNINDTYAPDRSYRTEHHSEKILPPILGLMSHERVEPGGIILDGDLVITPYLSDHHPASPAVGYRFDYRGRSVVVSGDSNITEETGIITDSVDILIHDARSERIIKEMVNASKDLGLNRRAKIFEDIQDYHASTESILKLTDTSQIKTVVFYHLVPTSDSFIVELEFKRGMPENFLVGTDRQWFVLPSYSSEIKVIEQ